ncbi:MAG: L-seryl-tRNA(Sec) selenium transferase [Myxococcota bacterium]
MNPRGPVNPDPRRALPSVDALADEMGARDPSLPAWALAQGARTAISRAREGLESGRAAPNHENMIAKGLGLAQAAAAPAPRPVINATGVVLHTNLGRAPLAPGAARAALAASGYSDLELDLETGRRGRRGSRVARKLTQLSGAEAASAVNNCAAAVLLALDTLARGREVVVSRGELVEIGGSFRVPDIMARAGVKLVEVGTTNRTHARDYERAIGPETALLLKVHRSNFELRGFVTEVGPGELVEIGRRAGVPVVEDLGSATLVDLSARGFPREAYAPSRLASGVDLVCFSGDKLLGGPQAGLVLGRRSIVEAMDRNPLARALRLDKMTLAALDWTLAALLGPSPEDHIPVLAALLASPEELEARARALHERLARIPALRDAGIEIRCEPDRAPVGGGSLPAFELDTWVVALRGGEGAEPLAARLRRCDPPVVARVRDEALLFDLRTLTEAGRDALAASLETALR